MTLGDVVEVLDSMRVPVNAEERTKRIGNVPYYGANGQQGWIDRALFDEPLILAAEDGGNFDEFATRPIAYRVDGPSWVNNHAHILRAVEGTDQNFVFWSLVHKDIRRYIAGGTRAKLTQAELRSIDVPCPPLPEQRQIAAILDTIEDTIRKTDQIIAKLKQVKHGLLHDLLTRGIDDNGEVRDAERHPEQFKNSPLGRIPRAWDVNSLASLCLAVVDCPHSTPHYGTAGVLVARTSQVRDGRFDVAAASRISEREYSERVARLEPKPGDIIFTREAPVGEAFVIPEGMRICLGQRVMLLRPNPARLDARYVVAQVYSGVVARRIELLTGGTTNPHLNVREVKEFTIPTPPVAEQGRVAAVLNSLEERLSTCVEEVAKLRLVKRGLAEDLLSGRVRFSAPEVKQ